jgi:hypothetical protein
MMEEAYEDGARVSLPEVYPSTGSIRSGSSRERSRRRRRSRCRCPNCPFDGDDDFCGGDCDA